MKTYLLIPLLIAAGITAGCGDSKINKIRAQFIDGCSRGYLSKDVCRCAFDGMQKQYSRDQLLAMGIGEAPKGFDEFMVSNLRQCQKDNP